MVVAANGEDGGSYGNEGEDLSWVEKGINEVGNGGVAII